ncbi:ribosomal protein S6 kinase delta-1 [Macrosteles quadrilineatus]|uniref:ribosomal protein S6 kinase delta-1 n=1 Tax=Macrosteles quadrilineatus TaxID=74068 RepID=UPI0023E1541D|nr:ribosomal protein S6 kinase delta-1 [Macrosteles quadrilineatus]
MKNAVASNRPSCEDNWVRRFSVSDPFKHNKGFTLYKITSLVYPKKYPEAITTITIWKRYNDFKKLHKELKARHKKLNISDEFPSFVKAKFFSRFEADVVEERRQAAFTLLDYVAQHPLLFTSDVFVKFFESGYTVDSETGNVSNSAATRSSSPLIFTNSKHDPDTGQPPGPGSSDDEHTSFTTDTDSISSPVQPTLCESPQDLSVEEETWSSQPSQLQQSQSQTTLSSLASVESLFSRRIQSFKNRFIGVSSEGNDNRNKEAETSRYWTEAQKVISTAEERERLGDHQEAFNCYKAAIAQLLSGVQNDTDPDRRKLVREKTSDYLCKAEFIANNFLSTDVSTTKKTDSDIVPLSRLWQPLSDLQYFKVVGVLNKVMLVIDSRTNFLFIIKALYKSAHPVNENKRCIFPRRIPYVVELNSIYETDSSVFLVLQYFSGGKLWDYISPFFQKPQETPLKTRRSSNNSNPYIGRRCLEPDLVSISTSDSCPSRLNMQGEDSEVRSTLSSPGTSYLDLIRDYAANKKTDQPSAESAQPDSYDNPDPANSPVYRIVTDTLSCNNNASENLPTLTASTDNLYRDVLTLVNSDFKLNIEESVDIETKDLVQHAQRLLQSVDATLLESESIISRVELHHQSTPDDRLTATIPLPDDRLTRDIDLLSVTSNHSNKSLDIPRLVHNLSSKGSSLVSSVEPDAAPQWCQLEVGGPGIAEDTVRRWAAQLVTALHALHQMGIICRDLNPENVLVSGSTVRLTYFCSFPGVEPQLSTQAINHLYTAPELCSIFPITQAADWWSLGTLLYHLLTGQVGVTCCSPVGPQLSTQAINHLYTAPELCSIFPITQAADWWSLGTLLYHLLTGQVGVTCCSPVGPQLSTQAINHLYTAPELCSIFPITQAADWWSLGTLLYHLLTGQVGVTCCSPVGPQLSTQAINHLYTAPELCSIFPITQAADWWSMGTLLYHLLTGQVGVTCCSPVEPQLSTQAINHLYTAPELCSIFPITQAADW